MDLHVCRECGKALAVIGAALCVFCSAAAAAPALTARIEHGGHSWRYVKLTEQTADRPDLWHPYEPNPSVPRETAEIMGTASLDTYLWQQRLNYYGS
jgi:hypothetical protein